MTVCVPRAQVVRVENARLVDQEGVRPDGLGQFGQQAGNHVQPVSVPVRHVQSSRKMRD